MRGNGTPATRFAPAIQRSQDSSSFLSSRRRLKALAKSRAAIVGQWVRGPVLQRGPNGVSNRLLLLAQVRIPEPQHLNPVSFQPGITHRVEPSLNRVAVLEAVQLDIETGFEAEEIQDVGS